MSIRVLLADDHAVLRLGLRTLVASQDDMEVVGEAGDGAETLATLAATRPTIVVFDLSMPRTDAFETIRAIHQRGVRTVVLTMHEDPAYAECALAAGASRYVLKKDAHTALLPAIRATALADRVERPRKHPAGGPRRGRPRAVAASDRELQVLRLLAQGHTNRDVAESLGISVSTAESLRARLGDKLGLRSRADIVRHALETGLLTPEAVLSRARPTPRPRKI